MATTATAAVGSSFSTAKHTLRCPLTKHLAPQSYPLLVKFGYSKTLLYSPISIGSIFHKWRAPRITGAAASTEAAAAVEVVVEEEEKEEGIQGVVEGGDEEDEEEDEEEEVEVKTTKLYIGNLPYHCDSAQLAGIIQQYGTPELVEVLYHRDTGKSRGFAFVTMSSVEDCNSVIENLDGIEYGGRYLRVNFSDKPRKREPLYPETEHKLFVGNLSWSVTSESLYRMFREYGNLVEARVLYDGETGKSRGYGFVCYSTRPEMENALASLNGMELEGRAMRVFLAQGKK